MLFASFQAAQQPSSALDNQPDADRLRHGRDSAFMSTFVRAIAFGFFLGLLVVLSVVLVWSAGLKFGQLFGNM